MTGFRLDDRSGQILAEVIMPTTTGESAYSRAEADGADGGCLGRWISGIPEALIRRVGRLIGTLIYRVDVPHRRIVRRNLHFAYPDWSEDRVRSTSRRIFENLGTTFLEIIQLRYLSADQLASRITIDGDEIIYNHFFDIVFECDGFSLPTDSDL